MTEHIPLVGATRATARVALITCRGLPDLDPDDQILAEALRRRGITVEAAVWDGDHPWSAYDLAILRSPWDYAPRRDEFIAWAATVPRLVNPVDIVAWNTDKGYLAELAAAGVPVVPTDWVSPGDPWSAGDRRDEVVIKPAVGAGSIDAGRYRLDDPAQRDLAQAHVTRLTAAGRRVMIQPYLPAVDTYGETALLFLDGEYSHAIRKGPMLTGPHKDVDGLFQEEEITVRVPSAAERATAEKVLGALPAHAQRLLYTRVDLLPGPDGEPVLIELELTEPSLFLATAPGAADRLAAAIEARLPG